ncbi:hypothetical protein EIP91_000452 [Steccherinum ochraceum]|uniref:Uncharacterized protein n=1 Tax=Steccherinum ochraceum TaxID=92696 RepID=A0A4V2MWQ6_9APHY|nr:hypothetical protein EIP91_000452 [Steccherinum ochraceum]
MAMNTYGRNRQSIADLEQELYDIFAQHPHTTVNDENQPVIPGDALFDVLRTFSRNHDSELMTPEEQQQLKALLDSNPGLAVTPQILLQFIAMRTTVSPRHSPEASPPEDHDALSGQSSDEVDDDYIGNRSRRRASYSRSHSRSSSRDSNGTSVYRPPSRPPSRGPQVPPKTPMSADSPFDVSRRQRATPLETSAPSSWSRRPAPPRRKSDAGRGSDSESSAPPISFSRSYGGRSRAPSNPSSPGSDYDYSGVSSPTYSRPHSRTQSQPQSSFGNFGNSPERDQQMSSHATPNGLGGLMSPPPSDNSFDEDSIDFTTMRINSLPMPRGGSDSGDSDEDDFDSSLGLVMDRSAASSTVSLDIQERLEALQKTNGELGRKLMEAENTLQRRLSDHELELEEMQLRLEEAKMELNATKREEKELRTKEKVNANQIAALESEVAKMVKSLENAKNSYQSLQKQYHEQCNESERYRETLRRRDEQIKLMKEQADTSAAEAGRWDTLRQSFEAQINALHDELDVAQQTTAALDEQKQENMLLKETIDRMRWEMDEMRTSSAAAGQSGGSGSVRGSVSKSLGAELLNKMKQLGDEGWDMDEDDGAQDDPHADLSAELMEDEEDTESEDVIQTIITRTKRKVASRAKKIETVQFEEVKEYSDASIQHEPTNMSSSSMQTDPIPVPKPIVKPTASFSIQTDPEPKPAVTVSAIQTESPQITAMSIQTDPEPIPTPIVRVSAEVQTDAPEPESEAAGSGNTSTLTESDDETLASSSSTLIPPTPKAAEQNLHPHDLPPAYQSVANEDRDQLARRVADETLKTWHKGMKFPIEPVSGGISEDAVEDWKALKEELGIECTAIERLVEESSRTGLPRQSKDGRARNRRSRFYNIYNTYVYGGDKDGGASSSLSISSTGQFLFCVGASAAVAFLVGHAMAPQYAVPGGASYYDRAAWSSFNTMQAAGEGFPGDGVAGGVFWGFLGRLGGEAARTLRGWPT